LVFKHACEGGKQPPFFTVLLSLFGDGDKVEVKRVLDVRRWNPTFIERGFLLLYEFQQLNGCFLQQAVDCGLSIHSITSEGAIVLPTWHGYIVTMLKPYTLMRKHLHVLLGRKGRFMARAWDGGA